MTMCQSNGPFWPALKNKKKSNKVCIFEIEVILIKLILFYMYININYNTHTCSKKIILLLSLKKYN